MRLSEDGIRLLISAALVSLMAVIAAHLWFIDLLFRQSEFGAFLATELIAFSMLLYLYTRHSYLDVNKAWFMIGCISLAFFLILAILE